MNDLVVSYKISDLGELGRSSCQDLKLLDITHYSFEGDLTIAVGSGNMRLVDVPLFEAFLAIRQILCVVPIFIEASLYRQYFREAVTRFQMRNDLLVINHKDIESLRHRRGLDQIEVHYVNFCRAFGSAAKDFVHQVEVVAPSVFSDERVTSAYRDLLVAARVREFDRPGDSIV